MNVKKSAFLLFAGFLLLASYQNCSHPSETSFTSNLPSKASDSGQSYDGKIYVLVGDLCSDGSNVRSKIVLHAPTDADLVRKDCSDIAAVKLQANEFQISSVNSNELFYQNTTFVASNPNAVGAGFGVSPKLSNTVDPTAYGAVGDGVTDNTNAFMAALNAGDILIPAGTYRVNGTISVPAGRSIQCVSPASVKIVNSLMNNQSNNATFRFLKNGGSISNCRISGAEVFNPNGSAVFDVNYQYNSLIAIVDYDGANSNVTVVNNILENCHGNACVSIFGGSIVGTIGVSNITVTHNTFRNCGTHAVVIDTGANNRVANNHITDCSVMIQNNNIRQPNLNNTLEYNFMTSTHGTGVGAPFITGGNGGLAVDYSSNQVRENTVIGNGTSQSIFIYTNATYPAKYSNNTCINGCTQQ